MKTIFKSALVAIVALAAGLTSCQNGNEVGPNDEAKSVVVRFIQENPAPESRAVGTHHTEGQVTLGSARVYFTTNSGVIMDYVTILFGGGETAAYNEGAKTVGINNVTSTPLQVTGLPGSVTTVVIVASAENNYTYYNTGNISQHQLAVANVYDSSLKGIAKVPLAGSDVLAYNDSDEVWEAAVTVAPVASRIEVAKISGNATGTTISSFTVAGIYMNNFYPTMAIDGLSAGAIVLNTAATSFVPSGVYSTDGVLSDTAAGSFVKQGGSDIIYGPKGTATVNDVWGYNLLAPQTSDAAMPHMVVHIKDVVIGTDDATTFAGDYYLTVRNFYLSGTTTPLAKMEKGTVYRVTDLKFSESDLTGNPEQNSVNVIVSATIMPWVANDVTTDFE